jgi:hypothetical protein
MSSASQNTDGARVRRSRKTLRRHGPEADWEGTSKRSFKKLRSPLLWIGGFIAILLLILVAQGMGKSRSEVVRAKEIPVAPASEEPVSEAIQPGTILHTIARFIAAREPADYSGFIRNEGAVMPMIVAHFQREEKPDWTLSGVEKQIERSGQFAVVKLNGKKLPSSRLILKEVDGVWLADWESFVVYQETPWEEISGASSPVPIRVSVSAHPKRTELFVLRDPLRNKTLTARAGAAVEAQPLFEVFEKRKAGAWILEVKSLPENPEEVVIVGIVCEGWVERGL